MRSLLLNTTILLLSFIGFYIPASYSQTPTYNLSFVNETKVSNQVYEADIYILNTSSAPFELATISMGISYNSYITGRGKLTASWVSSSSQLSNLSQLPTILNTTVSGYIKIPGKTPPGSGKGSIISNSSPGTKIGRLRLTNSTKFKSGQQMNLAWISGAPYPTAIFGYVSKINTNLTSSGTLNKSGYVDESTDMDSPKDFALDQNYPNPFNPTTQIKYQVPVDAKVILEVYDIAGQKIAELVNKDQSAGNYAIDFGSTGQLASGVYIYRMTATGKATGINFSAVKKMMLIK